VVLQPLQISGECDPDHVRPRRQELTKLHVARTEPRQRRRQPRLRGSAASPLDQAPETQGNARRRGQDRRIDETENAFAGEHETGLAETDEIRGAGNHKRQPEWSATIPPVMIL